MRENLWLNLTDGSILCGRRYFDGSGGNNHAVEHYRETGYPLAVKLGTITPDGAGIILPLLHLMCFNCYSLYMILIIHKCILFIKIKILHMRLNFQPFLTNPNLLPLGNYHYLLIILPNLSYLSTLCYRNRVRITLNFNPHPVHSIILTASPRRTCNLSNIYGSQEGDPYRLSFYPTKAPLERRWGGWPSYPHPHPLTPLLSSVLDVYSYDEDDMVLDPSLAEHLSHFGIDMLKMQKVRPSLASDF